MNTFISKKGTMTRVIVALSTAAVLAVTGVVVPQAASAVTAEELAAQILLLQAQLNELLGQQGGGATACTFTRDLFMGVSSGADVKCLQQYLNSVGNTVSTSGAGSPGNETTFFGSRTKAAVAEWQQENGVTPTAGYFGARSRAKYNQIGGTPPPPPPPPLPPPGTPPSATGTGLTVAAAMQPGDSLAPLSAARVPTTKFTVTASSDGDVRVNSVTVERQGPAANSSISSVVLLDEDGVQIGNSKTINSNSQAIMNQAFTVKAGTSRTITVAINRPASGSDGGGILKMVLVAVDAGAATVSGSLPIIGSAVTLNSTLSIGSVTLTRGVNDPGSGATKEVGTTGYIFTAIRLTSGSNEDLSVKSVSFNQSGSAASSDIKNVKIIVDGTEYAAKISEDGKYFSASFGSGVDITKGNQKEIWVKGDIENGTNRGVDFDMYRYTDLYVVGKSYGYGVTPSATDSGGSSTNDDGSFQATNPVWDAYEATIGGGSVTVTAATTVPAQNIAVNLSDQPLGGFDVDVKGEGVTVSSIVLRVSTNKNDSSVTEADFTDVKLVDMTTGKVVAGPNDGSGTTDGQMVFTFTSGVTLPIGKRTYVLKGKLSTDFDSDTLVSASTTPSSDWTSVTGDVSGTSITPANTGTVSGNSMTVKTGAVSIALSSSPPAQTVIRGATGFTFANIIFDATNSGEDVKFTSAQVQFNNNGLTATDVTNCLLVDGTKVLNDNNIVNPTTTGDKTFTLNNSLTVPKGTSKTVALKCDVSRSGTSPYVQWTFGDNDATAPSETFGATGLTSANSITPSVSSSTVTNLMSFSAGGTFSIQIEAAASTRLAQAGQEIEIVKLRLSGTNEPLDVKQIALQLSNTASNTPNDIGAPGGQPGKLTLWVGGLKVGEVTATSSDTGLIVPTAGLTVPKDGDTIVTVKAQLADIGNNVNGRPGHLLTIDWDQVNVGGNSATYAIGGQSSANVYATGSDTASNGVRVVRAVPTVTPLGVPTTAVTNTTMDLYRLSISAPAGTNGVSLYKLTFSIATSGDDGASVVDDILVRTLKLYVYTGSGFSGDAFSANPVNQGSLFQSSDGVVDGSQNDRATSTDYAIYFNPSNTSASAFTSAEALHIPAGSTYYFRLTGDVTGADSGDTISVRLMGDTAWFGIASNNGGTAYSDAGFLAGSTDYSFATTAPFVDEAQVGSSGGGPIAVTQGSNDAPGAGDDFIWSGNSTTTHTGSGGGIMGPDWYNGFQVPGLPSDGTSQINLTTS
ncbi:MAG: hypothetical protein A3B37_02770 [Candidatus Sungbacteria bacterium RIFCSPLOWO2_01_FULL_59_16]|uniref:Ig-like domain-containing protein n=1 Tax=Candidatus Sungbacteria bacterium RIFCSPLOWO2_01_FULL_59_16 TaxID=1802280 RepID=A0A1G2L9E3_9BACT|nr:MAG: hypothetical protein A3B37_02770 [Candidatus Sungbacteria bacterium RIFCSPLOWO2_01_FULL_59_16]